MNFQWLFKDTLRRRLTISLILLVMVAVSAIGIASIRISQRIIKDRTARFGGKMLTQAAYRLGSMIDNAETTVDSLILDRRLAPLLKMLSSPDRLIREEARKDLRNLLIQYKTSSLPGVELAVIDTAQHIVATYKALPIEKELVPKTTSFKTKEWRLRYIANFEANNSTIPGRLLELTARIISLPGQTQDGWIILHMDYRIIESVMTNISLQEDSLSRFQSEAIVFGEEKQIIFPWVAPSIEILSNAHQKLSGELRGTETIEEKINGKNYLVIAAPVPWTNWEVYISAPTKRLYTGLEQIYNSIFVIGLICALAAALSAALISFFITRPVNKLRKAMRIVEDGDFTVRAPEGGPLEIQTLGRAFNRMLQEVNMLTKQLIAEEGERKTAVIRALQAQIAPHFLFNTLAAMAGMTAKRPPQEVAEALRSLKRLLYLSVGKEGDFVSLTDEFEHIQHYIYLMNIRYPHKFILNMELPDNLRDGQTIRLILQPIVENALQHGLKFQGGLIRVSAYQEKADVILRVDDDGAGMTNEQVRTVWKTDQSRSGVGVRNVDQRIKLAFGPNYGLNLLSFEGKGTTVLLRIPLLLKEENLLESEGN